ncbi:hypothetical protein BpHYR1_049401 [Brachionus plicatilis]|uniref:Uncharacterized protein n=1 Tax=Brachionus plicatilis TaxID=10195 RepID=A0A3M7RDL0_BRAPC|nr:hypothetical protein BpHYR1_049401 [Brachionus plicatilis]
MLSKEEWTDTKQKFKSFAQIDELTFSQYSLLLMNQIFWHLEVDDQFKISFQFEDALHVIVYFEIFYFKNIKFQISKYNLFCSQFKYCSKI